MTNENLTALSLKEQCLRYAVHREVKATNLRDFNRNPDLIIGLIGDRGGGKSMGGAQVVVRDWMVRGQQCFSNISITPTFHVSDDVMKHWCYDKYGVDTGGVVRYESTEIDMHKFMYFDEEYRNSVFFIDEINIAMADARRSMSNQNLWAADIGQQLRKLKSALVYTCIKEDYVDVRIRDLTDFFIKTVDAAYVNDGIPYKKEGYYFNWSVYPMTDKAAANLGTFAKYQGGLAPLQKSVSGRSWWDTLDTLEHQERRKIQAGYMETASVQESIHENPNIIAAKQEWGWLEQVANRIVAIGEADSGIVPCYEVMSWPDVKEHRLTQNTLSAELNSRFNIWTKWAAIKDGKGRKASHYTIESAVLTNV